MKLKPWWNWKFIFILVTGALGLFLATWVKMTIEVCLSIPYEEVAITLPAWIWVTGFLSIFVQWMVFGYLLLYSWREWHKIKASFQLT